MTGRVFPLVPGSKLALRHEAQTRAYRIEAEADKKARVASARTHGIKPFLERRLSEDQKRQLFNAFKG